jgi:hypothetical protein
MSALLVAVMLTVELPGTVTEYQVVAPVASAQPVEGSWAVPPEDSAAVWLLNVSAVPHVEPGPPLEDVQVPLLQVSPDWHTVVAPLQDWPEPTAGTQALPPPVRDSHDSDEVHVELVPVQSVRQ